MSSAKMAAILSRGEELSQEAPGIYANRMIATHILMALGLLYLYLMIALTCYFAITFLFYFKSWHDFITFTPCVNDLII